MTMTTSQRDAGRLFARRMSRLTVLYADHSGPDESKLAPKVRAFLAHLVGLMWATYDLAMDEGAFTDDEQTVRIRNQLFQLGRGLDIKAINWCRCVAETASDFDAVLDNVIGDDLRDLGAERRAV